MLKRVSAHIRKVIFTTVTIAIAVTLFIFSASAYSEETNLYGRYDYRTHDRFEFILDQTTFWHAENVQGDEVLQYWSSSEGNLPYCFFKNYGGNASFSWLSESMIDFNIDCLGESWSFVYDWREINRSRKNKDCYFIQQGQRYTIYLDYQFSGYNKNRLGDIQLELYGLATPSVSVSNYNEQSWFISTSAKLDTNTEDGYKLVYFDFTAPVSGFIQRLDMNFICDFPAEDGTGYQYTILARSFGITDYLAYDPYSGRSDEISSSLDDYNKLEDDALGGKSDQEIKDVASAALDYDFSSLDSSSVSSMNSFYDSLMGAFGNKYLSCVLLSCTLGTAAFMIGRSYKDRGS